MINDEQLEKELGEIMNAADALWNENTQPDLQENIALIFNLAAKELGYTRRLTPDADNGERP